MKTLMPHQVSGAAFLAERGFAFLWDEMGTGKAQPIDAQVLTPEGFRPIGSIRPGDFVIGVKGVPVLVKAVFPQGQKAVWRVTMSDGATTRCCGDHLWAVNSWNRKLRGKHDYVTKSLRDIITPTDVRIKHPLKEQPSGRYRWQIPLTDSVLFCAKQLPIDPYFMGALLGDGHFGPSSVSLSKPDFELHEEIGRRLPDNGMYVRYSGGPQEPRCLTANYHGGPENKRNWLLDILRTLGLSEKLSESKFVPKDYLLSCEKDRLDLLRGLMDTDGEISRGYSVVFGSRSKNLADSVAFLCRSLGGTARCRTRMKVGKLFHSVTLAMPPKFNPFFIPRKAKAWSPRIKYAPQHAIADIRQEGEAYCVCLSVDSPDGLYVTDDFIVTHNTVTAIAGADEAKAQKVLVVCPAVVRMNWALEFLENQRMPRDINVVEGFLRAPPGDEVTIVSHDVVGDSAAERKGRGESWVNLGAGAPYDLVIVDEHHSFRTYDAARARNLWYPGGLADWTARLWALSGTPVVNSAADLWLPAFGPLKCGMSWWDWCTRYADLKPDPYEGRKPVGLKDAAKLAEFLRPHALRRTTESLGLPLPPLDVVQAKVAVPPAALTQAMAGLEGWSPQRLAQALEEKDDLRDAALARVRRVLGLAKASAVAERAHALLAGGCGPLVVFFQHTDVRDALHARLSGELGYKVSWIDGKVTSAQLAAARDWFQAGRLNVLLVQTQAGGVGLTLHKSNYCLIAELPWTSVALRQAVKRIHRIGQTRACVAEVLRADGCWLEDALASTVAKKQLASDSLLSLLTTGQS